MDELKQYCACYPENASAVSFDVYAYTLNYKTGNITERYGRLRVPVNDKERFLYCTPCGGHHFQEKDSPKYLTSCHYKEGVVRGSTVWFFEPNLEGARKAFQEKAAEMKRKYAQQAKRSCERSMVCVT